MNTQKMKPHAPETKEATSKPELVVSPTERKMDPAHVPHLPGSAPFTPVLPVNSPTFAPEHQIAAAGANADGKKAEPAHSTTSHHH
jgi:hypothetical protein